MVTLQTSIIEQNHSHNNNNNFTKKKKREIKHNSTNYVDQEMAGCVYHSDLN